MFVETRRPGKRHTGAQEEHRQVNPHWLVRMEGFPLAKMEFILNEKTVRSTQRTIDSSHKQFTRLR
jgi:hypothetical protein